MTESAETLEGQELAKRADGSPFSRLSFDVGVTENKNGHYRKTMEDVHTYVANFAERLDWGYFALFDGHAGKQTARWCGSNLHNILYDNLAGDDALDMRENLNEAFQEADCRIKQLSVAGSSGCTAAVAVLRWEEDIETDCEEDRVDGDLLKGLKAEQKGLDADQKGLTADQKVSEAEATDATSTTSTSNTTNTTETTAEVEATSEAEPAEPEPAEPAEVQGQSPAPFDFVPTPNHRRMLYTANAGDSRIVLCRGGQAVRLSYDHKSTDRYEQGRIVRSGGIMLKNRVNGVLAVTRSLGDCYMKNLVIGAPYTTATELGPDDAFMIIACDGLWDVCSDQEAVDLAAAEPDPQRASAVLCAYALEHMTTDNVTVMVVRFDTRVFGLRQ